MLIVLLKVSFLLAIPPACLPLMGRASSAMRHLLCALALGGALLLPLASLLPDAPAMTIRFTTRVSAVAGVSKQGPTVPWPAIWAIGSSVLLIRIAIGYSRASGVVRRAEPREGYSVADVSGPMVGGLLQPVILIPHSWPADRLLPALRHEQAHIDRGDLRTNLMANITCALYWFHPLAWLVAGQMRREQEAACDDAVLCSGFEPAVYAAALVATVRHFTSDSSLIGCHMLTQKTLKSRIARLLDSSLPRTSSTLALRRTTALFVAMLGCLALLQAQSEKIYKVGGMVSPPHVETKVDPDYTPEAKAAKIDGAVLLSVVIGTDGVPHDINIVKSLDAGLDVKAVEAVQKWHFVPGTKDGVAVATRATIEVNFRLL